MSAHSKALAAAAGLFIVWSLATWLLEGRIETLLRPDAVADRLVYAVVANLIIGIAGAFIVLRTALRLGVAARNASGFGSPARTVAAVLAGFLIGLAFYSFSGGASRDPVVILNAFAQVLVVSTAEVLVCWAVVGSIVEALSGGRGRAVATHLGAVAASILFGVYHLAHSPPFNSFAMIAFLSVVGLITSLFFFISRDVYGTIVFHNFLGVLGVVNALVSQGEIGRYASPQVSLLATALVTVAIVVSLDAFYLRRTPSRSPHEHSKRFSC